MRKQLTLLAALMLLPGFASAASEPFSGEINLEFGFVKNSKGEKVSVKGKTLRFTAVPIFARQMQPQRASVNWFGHLMNEKSSESRAKNFGSPSATGAKSSNTVVYQANAGAGYGYIENNPSSLDDVVMIGSAAGKPWDTISFGVNYIPQSTPTLVRWRCYETNTDNPAPQTDFAGEFADFGGFISLPSTGGQFLLEVDISTAGVSTNDTTIYVAQQFRFPSTNPLGEDGEGAFKLGEVDTVFNAAAPPTVGSSLDQFWFDFDPVPDGAYENTEIDVFEGSLANHLLTIKVNDSGVTQKLTALNAQMGIGRFVSGNFISVLNGGDNNLFRLNQAYNVSRSSPVGEVIVDFLNPFTNISAISFRGIAGATIADVIQGIDIYDFVNNRWVQVYQDNLGPLGLKPFTQAYGGTVDRSNFTGPIDFGIFGTQPGIRAKVRWRNTTFNVSRSWQMQLDLIECNVTAG